MPTEGGSLETLLERVVQMNQIMIEEMQEQRKHTHLQQEFISSQLSKQSLVTPSSDVLIDPISGLVNKINVKPKEYNGTNEENVVTWLTALEEVMTNRLIHDNEKISLAVSLLGDTALQWFVNLKLKNQQPSSWNEFKDKLKSQFQPIDFQEHLRQQLLQLRQKNSLQDYIHVFRSIVGQIIDMDELTQVMLFINGLSSNIGLYVRSKHPQIVEETIREATTYDNVMIIGKSNNTKYNPFLESSSNVELNAINTRQHGRYPTSFNAETTKDDCFKYGLCFYCKEPGHRALSCPKKSHRPPQQQSSTASSHQKKRSAVDVMGNTSTSALSFDSSCTLDVVSSSIISSIPDVQDVTESIRHDLTDDVDPRVWVRKIGTILTPTPTPTHPHPHPHLHPTPTPTPFFLPDDDA